MIKVLVVDAQKLDGVGWWRNARPFGLMRKQFRKYLDIRQVTESVDIREIMSADVVVMFRPTSPRSLEFVRICKTLGCKVINDIDDDLWNLDPHHPAFDDFEGMRDTARTIFEEADFVWTSTKQLMYAADCFGRGEVMQNAILPGDMPDAPAEWKGSGVVCWRGFNNQVGDILSDEAKEWYLKWRDVFNEWQFAGYFPELPHGKNVRYIPKVSPLAYFMNLQRTGANIIWKPLKKSLFNDAKSNIAWLEATMAGAVCVTNYAAIDSECWSFAMDDFETKPGIIGEVWKASKKEIIKNYNLIEVNERRMLSILRLLGVEKQEL